MIATSTTMNIQAKGAQDTPKKPWWPAELVHRQIFSREVFQDEVLRIRIRKGHLWVTFEGLSDDFHLKEGDIHRFHGPGLLVAEGIEGGAVFEISQLALNSGAP